MFKDIGDVEPYRDNWKQVSDFLEDGDMTAEPNSPLKLTRLRRAA